MTKEEVESWKSHDVRFKLLDMSNGSFREGQNLKVYRRKNRLINDLYCVCIHIEMSKNVLRILSPPCQWYPFGFDVHGN